MKHWITILVHTGYAEEAYRCIFVNLDKVDSIDDNEIVVGGRTYTMPSAQAERLVGYMEDVWSEELRPDMEPKVS